MKLNFSKKILLFSSLFMIGVFVIDFIFITLLIDKMVDIKDKENQLEISSQEREKELFLKESIINSEEKRSELEQFFVKDGNLETVKFTEYLEGLAYSMNLEHKKTLDYEPAKDLISAEFISAIRFRFSISGSWQNVFDFIRMIEKLPQISYLNTLALNVITSNISTKDFNNQIWSADLDFSVLRLK